MISFALEQEDPIEGQLYGASRHNGYIRCMGEVSACVFAHPTQMIADIDRYLRSDLMRSVSGRLRLFLDAFPGMADDQRLHAFSRLQPPRRVFFYPFLGSRIQFTDYLFDTEDAKVTVVNARQVFNVDITPYMVDQKREKSECVGVLNGATCRLDYCLPGMNAKSMFVLVHCSAPAKAETASGQRRAGGSTAGQHAAARPQHRLQHGSDCRHIRDLFGPVAVRDGAKER